MASSMQVRSQPSMLQFCPLIRPHSFELKSSIDCAPQLYRLKPHQLRRSNEYSVNPRFVDLPTRPRQRVILASAAAPVSTTPFAANPSSPQLVSLLGREFLQRDVQIATTGIISVVLSIANKLLYKMALVPLKTHPLFLAQLNTVAYVVAYSAILFVRYRVGLVTNEMLAVPKTKFVLIGVLEALAISMGMVSAAMLPGASLPVLTQAFLVWQLILSATILKERYTLGQIGGCFLVIAGVVMVVGSGSGGAASLQQCGYFWPLVMIVSTLFTACGSILKEYVFQDAAKQLKGGNLDIFVVNTYGSTFQAIFVFLILPLVFNVRGVPFHDIPRTLREGCICFINAGSKVAGCEGSPFVPLLYCAVNIALNIFSLSLLKQSSALVSSLCVTLSIPLSIWAFTFPWPYLDAPAALPPGLLLGAGILVAGLAFYSFSSPPPPKTCAAT